MDRNIYTSRKDLFPGECIWSGSRVCTGTEQGLFPEKTGNERL